MVTQILHPKSSNRPRIPSVRFKVWEQTNAQGEPRFFAHMIARNNGKTWQAAIGDGYNDVRDAFLNCENTWHNIVETVASAWQVTVSHDPAKYQNEVGCFNYPPVPWTKDSLVR